MTYNYDSFDPREYNLADFRGPSPGTKAPDFTVALAEGGTRRLLDFDGDFLVLEMGSLTCPLFQGRRPGMTRLDGLHDNVSFAVLYVREAHPGDQISAHATTTDKRACARRLTEDEGEKRRVFVDDLEGTVHAAYGGYPNSVFIINALGCVVYASDWNNPAATGRALDALLDGRPAQVRAYFKPVPPSVSLRVLGAGGKGAMADFLRGLPRLIWANLIRRNLRLLLNKDIGVAPDTSC